ncbi:pyruvate kinase [Nannochloropsis oceanica]
MLLLRRTASRRCLLQSSSTRLLAPSPVAVSQRQKVDYIPSFIESRKSLTKIIATIGPASEQFPELQACVKSGMRIMRLNFSHATYEEATLRINNLRKSHGVHSAAMGSTFNLRAVLLDIQGPKIRTGSFKEGSIMLEQGKEYILTTDESVKLTGDEKQFYVDYEPLYGSTKKGDPVLIDDGNVVLEVTGHVGDGHGVICKALNSGKIKNRRGVNVPNSKVDLPALTVKDQADLSFGVQNDIDFVAASFVRKAQDIHDIRAYLAQEMSKHWPATHLPPKIIAKIESTEAIQNYEEIMEAADGIMVARGDLGVEIDQADVTNMQKMMVRRCRSVGKPVIVATQMLESMQVNPRPTRAEVSDVTNAVYDGADCVMLSGESAQGKYPIESIATMRTIIDAAETWIDRNPVHQGKLILRNIEKHEALTNQPVSFYEAAASAAVQAAFRLKAKVIIVHTKDGSLAKTVAKYSPFVPCMCFTNSQKVAKQLIIHRGLHPIVIPDGHLWNTNKDVVLDHVKRLGFAGQGDRVVVLTGELQHEGSTSTSGTYYMDVK